MSLVALPHLTGFFPERGLVLRRPAISGVISSGRGARQDVFARTFVRLNRPAGTRGCDSASPRSIAFACQLQVVVGVVRVGLVCFL